MKKDIFLNVLCSVRRFGRQIKQPRLDTNIKADFALSCPESDKRSTANVNLDFNFPFVYLILALVALKAIFELFDD